MKKLLGLLLVLVLASCGTNKTEQAYIDFVESDTLIVGYQYLFTYNDSADMNYSVFNPAYAKDLAKYSNLTYADSSDVVSARGYYLVLRALDGKVAVLPKESEGIPLIREASWKGFVKWRDRK